MVSCAHMVDRDIAALCLLFRLITIVELVHEVVFNFRKPVSHIFIEWDFREFFLLLILWEFIKVNFWHWIIFILL